MSEAGKIGRNVERLRKAKGWTQSEVARRSGVSQTFISSLEGGRRRQALVELVADLARALGCTVDDLLREPESGEEPR